MENVLVSDQGKKNKAQFHAKIKTGSEDEMLSFCTWCVDEPDSVCFHPGHLRLSDFGLSRRLKRGGRAFTICGTMQYMGELCGEASWGVKHCWWLIACRLTTVEPFLHASAPMTHFCSCASNVCFFPLWKKEMHPFFTACVWKKTYFSRQSHLERFISPVWSEQLQRF